MMKARSITTVILGFLLVPLVAGCSTWSDDAKRASSRSVDQVGTTGSPPSTTEQAVRDEQVVASKLPGPVKIVVFQDKSGSADQTRTEQLTSKDFEPPITLLRRGGGELAVGVINERSSRSLLRLRIEVPPARPREPQVENVFERAQQNAAFADRLAAYDEAFRQWNIETENRIRAFLAQLDPVLQGKAIAKRTNVWSAIDRADLFLNEPDAGWPSPTRRYALINSDAIDTARSKPVPMKSGARLLLVNGAGSVGVLQPLNPERFESVKAAFHFISGKENGGN